MFNKLSNLKPDSLEACLRGLSRGLGTVSLRNFAGFPALALANQVCS